jgi:hypothetical protein
MLEASAPFKLSGSKRFLGVELYQSMSQGYGILALGHLRYEESYLKKYVVRGVAGEARTKNPRKSKY